MMPILKVNANRNPRRRDVLVVERVYLVPLCLRQKSGANKAPGARNREFQIDLPPQLPRSSIKHFFVCQRPPPVLILHVPFNSHGKSVAEGMFRLPAELFGYL